MTLINVLKRKTHVNFNENDEKNVEEKNVEKKTSKKKTPKKNHKKIMYQK